MLLSAPVAAILLSAPIATLLIPSLKEVNPTDVISLAHIVLHCFWIGGLYGHEDDVSLKKFHPKPDCTVLSP